MFLGVEYLVDGDPVRVALDTRNGCVPVATRNGGCLMTLVGQGEKFVDRSPGQFQGWPEGSVVTLDTLHQPAGLWIKWRSHVRPVKIAVTRFFYTDALGYRTPHDLRAGEFLQGALLSKKVFERVYFVVVPQPGTTPQEHCWWPRIIGTAQS